MVLVRRSSILIWNLFLCVQVQFLVAKVYTLILSNYFWLAYFLTVVKAWLCVNSYNLLLTSSTSESKTCFQSGKQAASCSPPWSTIDNLPSFLVNFQLRASLWHQQSVFWWQQSFYLQWMAGLIYCSHCGCSNAAAVLMIFIDLQAYCFNFITTAWFHRFM